MRERRSGIRNDPYSSRRKIRTFVKWSFWKEQCAHRAKGHWKTKNFLIGYGMRNFLVYCAAFNFYDLHGQTLLVHGPITLLITLPIVLLWVQIRLLPLPVHQYYLQQKPLPELKKMSRIDGLTETGIIQFSWSEENKTTSNSLYKHQYWPVTKQHDLHIPDISRKNIPGKKDKQNTNYR